MRSPVLKYDVSSRFVELCLRRGVQFCQLGRDAATDSFLESARPATPFNLLLHSTLRMFMSHYDANAFLRIFPLHLLSSPQLSNLLSVARAPSHFSKAIDIGGGDGSMALNLLQPLADNVVITETSSQMAKRARENGLTCLELDISDPTFQPSLLLSHFSHNADSTMQKTEEKGDLMTILNVIDRTKRPQTLLKRALDCLREDGFLVLASPLPIVGRYYDGPWQKIPQESLVQNDARQTAPQQETQSDEDGLEAWEKEASWLMFEALPALGIHVHCFGRVPYISAGDLQEPFVVFDDIVVVCSKSQPRC